MENGQRAGKIEKEGGDNMEIKRSHFATGEEPLPGGKGGDTEEEKHGGSNNIRIPLAKFLLHPCSLHRPCEALHSQCMFD